MRHFISSVSFAFGWLLMIMAVVSGLFWTMSLRSLHRMLDFGVHSARVTQTMLWLLPLLAISSTGLLYCSYRVTGCWSKRVSPRLYWVLLSVTILVWGMAWWDFRFHPAHLMPMQQPSFPRE